MNDLDMGIVVPFRGGAGGAELGGEDDLIDDLRGNLSWLVDSIGELFSNERLNSKASSSLFGICTRRARCG